MGRWRLVVAVSGYWELAVGIWGPRRMSSYGTARHDVTVEVLRVRSGGRVQEIPRRFQWHSPPLPLAVRILIHLCLRFCVFPHVRQGAGEHRLKLAGSPAPSPGPADGHDS